MGETATLAGSELPGPAVQCSADRRGHTEGGRAAPEKFHLSDPKEQEGSSRSIQPAVIRSGLGPQTTPQSLPHKLPAALTARRSRRRPRGERQRQSRARPSFLTARSPLRAAAEPASAPRPGCPSLLLCSPGPVLRGRRRSGPRRATAPRLPRPRPAPPHRPGL